jgi:GNAT superfamily N-acetyltransferase
MMVEFVPSPPGPTDAIVAFTGHVVIATSRGGGDLAAQLPPGSLVARMEPRFLIWFGHRLGSKPGPVGLFLVAHHDPEPILERVEVSSRDHPRARRAMQYCAQVRVFETLDRSALVVIGRDLAGRFEVGLEVLPDRRRSGFGRRLAAAARPAVEPQHFLFAQVPPRRVDPDLPHGWLLTPRFGGRVSEGRDAGLWGRAMNRAWRKRHAGRLV